MPALTFRAMREPDWIDVQAIYRAGIATGHATFETAPPTSWTKFAAGKRPDLMLVAIDPTDRILGWAAASPVSTRTVYRGVVEHSIYIHPDAAGQGIGTKLLDAILALADRAGVWTIQSSTFPENIASLHLHEHAGFRIVGRRERIARMDYGPHAGHWRDTILVERRAPDDPTKQDHQAASSASIDQAQA